MEIAAVGRGQLGVTTEIKRIEKIIRNKASLCIWERRGQGWHVSQEAFCAIIKEGQRLSHAGHRMREVLGIKSTACFLS